MIKIKHICEWMKAGVTEGKGLNVIYTRHKYHLNLSLYVCVCVCVCVFERGRSMCLCCANTERYICTNITYASKVCACVCRWVWLDSSLWVFYLHSAPLDPTTFLQFFFGIRLGLYSGHFTLFVLVVNRFRPMKNCQPQIKSQQSKTIFLNVGKKMLLRQWFLIFFLLRGPLKVKKVHVPLKCQ